jgi:hypothetical protein
VSSSTTGAGAVMFEFRRSIGGFEAGAYGPSMPGTVLSNCAIIASSAETGHRHWARPPSSDTTDKARPARARSGVARQPAAKKSPKSASASVRQGGHGRRRLGWAQRA